MTIETQRKMWGIPVSRAQKHLPGSVITIKDYYDLWFERIMDVPKCSTHELIVVDNDTVRDSAPFAKNVLSKKEVKLKFQSAFPGLQTHVTWKPGSVGKNRK